MSGEQPTAKSRIINEIYTTEESYVTCLKQCMEYYHKPFLNCSETNEQVKNQIFVYLPEVTMTSQSFMSEMVENKEKKVLEKNILGIFVRFLPFLKVYKPYIGNNEICLQTLAEIEKNAIVTQFLEECRMSIQSTNQQPLRSMLIMPVQRIPRYVLLFKELLKHTDKEKESEEYEKIEMILNEVEVLAKECNASLTNTERMLKLIKIRDNLKGFQGELVNSNRVFVKEGFLKKQCRKTMKARYFYLFNDLLVFGSESMGTVSTGKDKIIPLATMLCIDIPDSDLRKFAIQIQSNNRSFVVYAKDDEDKQSWLKAINEQREEALKTIGGEKATTIFVRPVFRPDDEVTKCEMCNIEFTFFTRRHHCRTCGKCICGECSKWRIKLPPEYKEERVCGGCFTLYKQNKINFNKFSDLKSTMNENISNKSIFEQQNIGTQNKEQMELDGFEVIDDMEEFLKEEKKPAKPRPNTLTSKQGSLSDLKVNQQNAAKKAPQKSLPQAPMKKPPMTPNSNKQEYEKSGDASFEKEEAKKPPIPQKSYPTPIPNRPISVPNKTAQPTQNVLNKPPPTPSRPNAVNKSVPSSTNSSVNKPTQNVLNKPPPTPNRAKTLDKPMPVPPNSSANKSNPPPIPNRTNPVSQTPVNKSTQPSPAVPARTNAINKTVPPSVPPKTQNPAPVQNKPALPQKTVQNKSPTQPSKPALPQRPVPSSRPVPPIPPKK